MHRWCSDTHGELWALQLDLDLYFFWMVAKKGLKLPNNNHMSNDDKHVKSRLKQHQ